MNGRQHPERPDWLGEAGRVYLDATVFESEEGLRVSLEQVLPAVNRLNGRVKLVVCASSSDTLERGSSAMHGALLAALRQAGNHVAWLRADPQGRVAASPAALIDDDCTRQKFHTSLLIITQSDKDAQNLDNPAQAANSKKAHEVRTACIQGNDVVAWPVRRRIREHFGIQQGELRQLARSTQFVVDTCSFLFSWTERDKPGIHPDTGLQFITDVLLPMLMSGGHQSQIVIPRIILREVESGARSGAARLRGDERAAFTARLGRVRQLLAEWQQQGVLRVIEDPVPGQHGDVNLEHMLTHEGSRSDLCFITQDRKLADSLLLKLPGPPRLSLVTKVGKTGRDLLEWQSFLQFQAQKAAARQAAQTQEKPAGQAAASESPTAPGQGEGPRVEAGAAAPATAGAPAGSKAGAAGPAEPEAGDPREQPATAPKPAPESAGTAQPEAGAKATAPATPVVPPTNKTLRVATAVLVLLVVVLGGLFWPSRDSGGGFVSGASEQVHPSSLRVLVLVDGRPAAMSDGGVFLPNGTRFTLQIEVPADGRLDVQALSDNPAAASLSVVSTDVKPGLPVSTPTLRVAGAPGVDRLHLVFVPDREGLVQQQEVLIRHD